MKFTKTLLFLSLVLFFGSSVLFAQKVDWPIPIAFNSESIGNTSSFKGEDYIYKYRGGNTDKIWRFDGKQWDYIPYDFSGPTDITGYAHYTAVCQYSSSQYDEIVIYDSKTEKWESTPFEDDFPSYEPWNVEFYKKKLYIYARSFPYPNDKDGAVFEYDLSSKKLIKLFDLEQDNFADFKCSFSYINLFTFQDKLYISGAYDEIDGKRAQGLSYYDGASLTALNIFPTSTQYNVNAEVLSKNELIAYYYKADGNDLSGSKLYVLKNDKIHKDITSNAFTDHLRSQWSAQCYFHHGFTHAFKMDDDVIWPVGSSFLRQNKSKSEWEVMDFDEWDLDAHFFKGDYYLTCNELMFPNETAPRTGVFKIGEVDVFRTYLFADLDKDCTLESSDRPLSDQFLRVTGNGYDLSLSSDDNGFVNLMLEEGSYNLDLNSQSISLDQCHSGSVSLNTNKLKGGNLNLAAQFNENFDGVTDFDVTITNRLIRRGRTFTVKFKVENLGSVEDATTPIFHFDKRLELKSSSESYSSPSHGVLKFNMDEVSFFDPKTITLTFLGDPDSIGTDDTLCFMGTTSGSMDELDTLNNKEVRYVEVSTPLDPNNMISYPGKRVQKAPVFMDYTVNFQNMGKDTAFDVRIIDSLPSRLDPVSIKIIDHSGVEIKSSIENGVLDIFFDEIKLAPKSISEEGSMGYVSFRITFSEPLTPGSSVTNNADIYFDFEEPVRTNDARTFHDWPSSKSPIKVDVRVFPNPATTTLHFSIAKADLSSIELFNAAGQQFAPKLIGNNSLDLDNLPQGSYVLKLHTSQGAFVKNFVRH